MNVRRLIRHLLFGLAGVLGTAALSTLIPTDFVVRRITIASAFVALAFLSTALVIGPLMVLRGKSPPRHIEVRRDVGIWAAIIALFHVGFGLQVHFSGVWIHYFVYGPDESHSFPLRYDWIGIGNWTGLAATLILVLLLALSNNVSLRVLGGTRWKRWQRWSYGALIFTALHGVIFQVLVKRPLAGVSLLWFFLIAVAGFQLVGFRRRRRTPTAAPEGVSDV